MNKYIKEIKKLLSFYNERESRMILRKNYIKFFYNNIY